MIGHHIAQRACLFVIARAASNAFRFRRRNLDVVHIVAVPDRLEHRVAEAKENDVLHSLLAEIMIYTIDLILVEDVGDQVVQLARGFQVASERFFDHDARPAFFFGGELYYAESMNNRRRDRWRRREIEQTVLARAFLPSHLFKTPGDQAVSLDLVKIALQIMQASDKRPPLGVADLASLFRAGAHPLAVFFIAYLLSRHAQHLEAARQAARAGQTEEGGNKLSCGEVSQRPEDHDDAWIGLRQR